MGYLLQDIRHGARWLARQRGFTVVAVLTLALGIGANTALFSVVNALLLQPLALPDSERLVLAMGVDAQGRRAYVSYPDFLDWRAQAKLFEGLSGFVPQSVNLTGRDEPRRVRGGFVSDNFFQLIGVEPAVGRGFRPGEDELGAERVCVVNYAAWQSQFGADPELVGKTLTLNNEPFTVVGIMPAGFIFPFDEIEVWIPYHHWPVFPPNYQNRGTGLVAPLARLKPGVTMERAQAELATIAARLAQQYPEAGEKRSAVLQKMHEVVVEDVRTPALILFAAVCFVSLIACANVANLLLVRAASRRKELATRIALGAGKLRLISQILTETGLLWLVGAALGLILGWWGVDLLLLAAPGPLPGGITVRFDAVVLLYTLGMTLLTGVVFGLIPALKFSTPNLTEALKESSRGQLGGSRQSRLLGTLVASQVALALLLLTGSALMIRSYQNLTSVNTGFRPQGLLTMEYRLPRNKYTKGVEQVEFHRRVVEEVRSLPGVASAAVVRSLPFSGNGGSTAIELPGQPQPAPGEELRMQFNTADIYYFATIGIPLLQGRTFSEQDTLESPPVTVISRSMADRFWPGRDPLGEKVRIPDTPPVELTIVGVVANIKHSSLREPDLPQMYVAQAQNPGIFNTLVVRTQGEPMSFARAVQKAVWSVDKDQPVWKIRTVEYLLSQSVGLERFIAGLMGVYSILAALLAAVGIYGVLAYTVTQRTQEIGLRMALGAQTDDILRWVLGRGLRLTLIGLAAGLAGAFALTRLMASLLFGVKPTDPVALAAASLLLLAAALAACYLPARRATRVDPMVALRYE